MNNRALLKALTLIWLGCHIFFELGELRRETFTTSFDGRFGPSREGSFPWYRHHIGGDKLYAVVWDSHPLKPSRFNGKGLDPMGIGSWWILEPLDPAIPRSAGWALVVMECCHRLIIALGITFWRNRATRTNPGTPVPPKTCEQTPDHNVPKALPPMSPPRQIMSKSSWDNTLGRFDRRI